ncbi:MAG: hypothetical protein KDJ78_13790 [Rhodobacteraceae bacterium]|uniref:hypothetical protein n=1 Tax=Amaricoccus sp. TaxID=1872485 RepID=UPI001D254B3A|nr:hypothetical protein [Amaricoccus sp.]MCB1375226.1 hypothetical protein [Paracoccaceae bacterium]HRW16900.1 hypothetical protein [Amaricoccus sp.]
MRSFAPALAMAALLPWTAMAQINFSHGPEEGAVTCGQFVVMDSVGQMQALTAVEPIGGEMPDADPALAAQWAATVNAACTGHPDRLLQDVAVEALGGN